VIYNRYGGLYPNKDGIGYPFAMVQPSPLNCCGAVSLQSLNLDTTEAQATEVFTYLATSYRRLRGLMAVPVEAPAGTVCADVDKYLAVWVESALAAGWEPIGDVWRNPNTGRILQMYFKDFT